MPLSRMLNSTFAMPNIIDSHDMGLRTVLQSRRPKKDEVSARCGESKSQKIRRLLAGEQLGDRKPSELFRVMQRRSESHNVTDSLLLELFFQQLPPNVQSILASIQPLTAQKASEVADRTLEVTPVQVSAVSKYSSTNSDDSSESKLLKELKLLRQEATCAHPVVIILPHCIWFLKKESNDWRPVGDFRALKAQTKKDKYPIPSILDFTSDLHGAKIFSHIDLVKAFHQIPIASEDIHKTAICTPFGLFESTRMQFGLCNAASTFQRFIDEVTRGLKGVYAFIDDILIASQNIQEHTTNLRALFERLDYYGLTIKPSKCTFGVDSLKFLGFQVSSESILPLPDRVNAIPNFPRPNTLMQLRRFLGMFNFYRRFIPKAAHILALLIKFLEEHTNKKKPCRPSKNPQTPLE
ncbi:hypothetical protein TNCV_4871391 [Trichonephila clavipes]|nr:hypothetical protein TNCV_4871391 [Trichonephila clavipes]